MASIDLAEYKECIFVIKIDPESKILGTFFANNFEISVTDITGNNIIYLQTNDTESEYTDIQTINIDEADENIFLVHTETELDSKQIYSVTIRKVNILHDKIDGIIDITKTDQFEKPTSLTSRNIEGIADNVVIERGEQLYKEIKVSIHKLENLLNSDMFSGGSKEEEEKKEDRFKQVIYTFQNFVNRFVTDSIIFQINSLNAEQINNLFTETKTIIINTDTYNLNVIKKPLFDNIYSNCFDFYKDYLIDDENILHSYDETTYNKATFFYIFKPLESNRTKDTDMYNSIIKPNEENSQNSQKIHIYHIANQFIVFYNNFYKSEQGQAYFNGIINNIYDIIQEIITNFKRIINIKVIETNKTNNLDMSDIIKGFHKENNKDFRNNLSLQLEKNASDKIITYVKINNFEEEDYNKRFEILIKKKKGAGAEKEQNAMIVNYNDHNFPYYIKNNNNNKIIVNEDKLKNGEYFALTSNKQLNVKKYKNTYLFGNYSQIFKPDKSNQDIANQMNAIIAQVTVGKPVFILGYGASGSGKTSSLIYYNKGKEEEKNGILIHLCNILGGTGYETIKMTAKEYFTVNNKKPDRYCDGDNTMENPIHCDTNEFTFTYKDNNFVLDSDVQHISKHEYRLKDSQINTFKKGANMGDVMIYLIDRDRFVKATTNNPQSSRSHSMIYLKLIGENVSSGYIIVGDYAGVENEFTCENASTIIDFLEKNRDCEKDCKPFYSEEFIPNTDIFDPYNDGNTGIEANDDETAIIYKNPKTIQQMISDFVTNNPDCKVVLYNIFFNQTNKYVTDTELIESYNNLDDLVYNYLRKDTNKLENSINKIKAFENHIKDTSRNLKLDTTNKTNGGAGEDVANSILEYLKELKIVDRDSDNNKNNFTKVINDNQNNFTKVINDRNELVIHIMNIISSSDETKINENITYINQSKFLEVHKEDNKINIKYIPEKDPVFIHNFLSNRLNQMDDSIIVKIYHIVVPNEVNDVNITASGISTVFRDLLKLKYNKKTKIYEPTNTIMNRIYRSSDKQLVFSDRSEMDPKTYNKYINEIIKYCITNYSEELKNEIDSINSINEELSSKNEIQISSKRTKIKQIKYENLNSNFIKYLENNSLDKIIENDYFSPLYVRTTSSTLEEKKKWINQVMFIHVHYFEKIVNFFEEIQSRFVYGINICERRVFEGKFINESLRQIRENIKDIITVKSQDKVFNSPDYIDICLEQYCPTHADCFKTNPIDGSKLNTTSVLIKSIYEYIKLDKGTEYTVEQFYKDILISIFCVFNISRQANNPPPVPYIDINDLKIHTTLYEKNKEETTKTLIINHLKRLYYKLNEQPLKDDTEYTDETTFQHNQVSVILSSDEYTEIYENNENFENFEIDMLKRFIRTIDNNNAVSAIGTLEFVDQIAKYNTTNTICSAAKLNENFNTYINQNRFDNLYTTSK